jgi:diguanylate cyclase (GGDEF)-like protein/PAS domain S-box-containing protein
VRRDSARPELDDCAVLEAAFLHVYNAMVITDADFDGGGPFIRRCNPAFRAMTGYTEDELIGRSPRILQGRDTDRDVIDRLRRQIRAGEFFEGSTVNYRKDGRAYVVQWNISPVRDDDGAIVAFASVQQDITARLAAERERSLLAEALNAATDPVIVTDDDFRIVFANSAFASEIGRPVDDLLGRSAFTLEPRTPEGPAEPQIRQVLAEGKPYRGVVSFDLASGKRLHVDLSISSLLGHNDLKLHYVAIAPNITHMVEQQMALQEMANIDAMTGLLNRRAGQMVLDSEIQQAAGSGTPMSVVMGDIDRFKEINDRLGHAVGDDVLRSVAASLRGGMRGSDFAVRWGGEEFLIVLPGTSLEDAVRLAERVRSTVATTAQVAAGPVTMSLGVGQWRPGEDLAALVQRIDVAMYAAKSGGRNRVVASD